MADTTKSGEKAEQLPQHTNSASRPSKREPAKKATVVQSKKKPPAAKYPPPSTKKNEKAQRAKGKRGRRPCSREGCPNQAKFRGVCIRHYQCLFVAESKGQCTPTRLRPPPHWLAADSWKECVANINRWNKLSSEDQNREFLKYKTLSMKKRDACVRSS